MARNAITPLWSNFGINMGSDINFNWGGGRGWPSDAVGRAQIDTDVAFLVGLGIKYFRVATCQEGDSHGLSQMRYLAAKLASYPGVEVQYGIAPRSSGAIQDQAGQDQFVADCIAEAIWAEANGIARFQVGNELEINRGTLTQAQVYTFQQTIPAQLKASVASGGAGFTGKITTSVSQDNYSQWTTNGIGNFDDVGMDIYGAGSDLTGITNFANFQSQCNTVKTALGSNVFLSEWGCNASGVNLYTNDVNTYGRGMRLRLEFIKSTFSRPCYLFPWRHDGTNVQDFWACKTNPGDIRPFFYDMVGQRRQTY